MDLSVDELEEFIDEDEVIEEYRKIIIEKNIFTPYHQSLAPDVDLEYCYQYLAYKIGSFSLMFALAGYERENISKTIRDYLLCREYEKAFNITFKEWLTVGMKIKVSWDSHPDKLNRELIIPIKHSLSMVIYTLVYLFRGDLDTPSYLKNEDEMYVDSRDRFAEYPLDSIEIASEYISYLLVDLDNPKLVYGKDDSLVFNIEYQGLIDLDEEQGYDQFILLNGKGYGISDYNSNSLDNILDNNDMDILNPEFDDYQRSEFDEFIIESDTDMKMYALFGLIPLSKNEVDFEDDGLSMDETFNENDDNKYDSEDDALTPFTEFVN